MTRIPDPMQAAENRMDSWAEDNIRGDSFLCPGCDKWCSLDDALPSSADPWSLPICSACAEEIK